MQVALVEKGTSYRLFLLKKIFAIILETRIESNITIQFGAFDFEENQTKII